MGQKPFIFPAALEKYYNKIYKRTLLTMTQVPKRQEKNNLKNF